MEASRGERTAGRFVEDRRRLAFDSRQSLSDALDVGY
jgi:hypothetical protein